MAQTVNTVLESIAWVLTVLTVLTKVTADSSPEQYELPSNSSLVNGGPIFTGFSCNGLKYGYYADVNNGCRVFHVCYPYLSAEGVVHTRMWSFICGLGTIFNQEALVCDHPRNTLPCDQATNFYNINDYFGRDELNFRE